MRNLVLSFIVTLYLATLSYAAPCYGTRMPTDKELQMGLQSYTIFKRYLANQTGKLRSSQEFLLLSYGIFDWLSIDLKGGAGFIKQHPVGGDELDYPTFMGGGYGFRLKLYDAKNTRAVFGFQHISIHPRTIHINDVKHKAVLDDWQFSVLASYTIKKITPYIGTRWSRCDYIHWENGERNRIKSDLTKDIGLIFGFDFPLSKKAWVNLEGSFFDSEAFALSLNYSF